MTAMKNGPRRWTSEQGGAPGLDDLVFVPGTGWKPFGDCTRPDLMALIEVLLARLERERVGLHAYQAALHAGEIGATEASQYALLAVDVADEALRMLAESTSADRQR